MAGLVATAKSSLYSATKFAAIGFSNALRLELMPFGVHVTTVNPGPIRTTFFDQADPDGSYVKAVDRYILEPDFVAKKIVKKLWKSKTRAQSSLDLEPDPQALYPISTHLGQAG